jgi:hypothetical protein
LRRRRCARRGVRTFSRSPCAAASVSWELLLLKVHVSLLSLSLRWRSASSRGCTAATSTSASARRRSTATSSCAAAGRAGRVGAGWWRTSAARFGATAPARGGAATRRRMANRRRGPHRHSTPPFPVRVGILHVNANRARRSERTAPSARQPQE